MSDVPTGPSAPTPADAPKDGGWLTLGAAPAPAPAPAQGSVLKLLQSKSKAALGVRLPEAPGDSVASPTLDAGARALRDAAGRYQVLDEVGRGGVGVVYRGHDVDLGRDVALKVLREEFAQHPEVLARFIEEAQIGGQLQHPGIVPVYEIGLQSDERPFFAMKLVKGETLAVQLARRKDPGEDRRRLLGIFEQVCQTIAFAHARRVVHRDLKPGNVMIGAFGEVQVVDWGFAKVLPKPGESAAPSAQRASEQAQVSVISTARSQPSASSHSVVGSTMGTPAYMPPEQALGDVARMDQRSDVFGLGAILCEILTGQPVYLADGGDMIQQAARGDVAPAHARIEASGADASLIALCKQCLAPSRQARPASALEVAQQVGAYLSSVEERAREAQIRAAEAKVRARSTLLLAAAALLIVILGGGGYAWISSVEAGRRAQADARVAEALNEASGLLGQARAAGVQDLAPWDRAVSAAEQAERLTHDDDVGDEQRTRVAALLADARGESEAATRSAALAALDAMMLRRLLTARIPSGDKAYLPDYVLKEARRLDTVYAECFRDYLGGRDLLDLDLEAATAALAAGSIDVELAAGLDMWALNRQLLGQEPDAPDAAATGKLQQLAQRLDHEDAWRRDLRELLTQGSPDPAALDTLARSADFGTLSTTSVALLGYALWNAGAMDSALEVYRRGQARHPADFRTAFRLGFQYESLPEPRWDAAVASYRIAVALQPELKEARHRLGLALEKSQDTAGAFEVFEQLVAMAPEDPHFLGHKGGLALALGRPDDAVAMMRRVVELDPEDAGHHYNLGVALTEQGHPDDAIASYRRAIELDPDSSLAHANLGALLVDQGLLTEAMASFRKTVELDPEGAGSHSNLGVVLAAQGSLDDAIASFQRAIELDPEDADAHTRLGACLHRLGRLDESIASYRTAIELDPDVAEAHNLLGAAQADLGRQDEAIASFRKAIELDPEGAGSHYSLGVALSRQGHPADAIASYRRAVELDPGIAAMHYRLGVELATQGHLDDAMASLRKAIELDPGYAEAHSSLGGVQLALGRQEDAIASFRQAIELDPQNAHAYDSLGMSLATQGLAAEAIQNLRKAVELHPDHAVHHLHLGVVLQPQGQYTDAIASFRKSIELDPGNALAHEGLGGCLASQGLIEEAIASLRKSIELDPEDATTHGNLGICLARQGRYDEAIVSLRKAIVLDPTLPQLHKTLASCLSQLGQAGEALALCRRLLELDPDDYWAYVCVAWWLSIAEDDAVRDPVAALQHAQRAIELTPESAPPAEVANNLGNLGAALYMNGLYDEALEAIERGRALAGDGGARALFRGLCQRRLGQEAEALKSFQLAEPGLDALLKADPWLRRFTDEARAALASSGK